MIHTVVHSLDTRGHKKDRITMLAKLRLHARSTGCFVAGAVAGVATTGLYVYSQESLRTMIFYPNGIRPHKALRFGTPESSKIRYFTNFVSQVDYKTRNPLWVVEHIPGKGREPKSTVSRKGVHYKEDEEIDYFFRGLLSHYRGSGYDRGHMSPAANNKNSEKAMRESFLLSNCCPQVGKGFNQDYWARFERFIHDVVKPTCDNVYVVTGPLYLDKGKEGVTSLVARKQHGGTVVEDAQLNVLAVPSHFYKVILGELSEKKDTYVLGAFVMPNAQIHPKTPLIDFQVDVGQLEQIAGISFFPKVKHLRNAAHSHDICGINNCKLPREQFWLKE